MSNVRKHTRQVGREVHKYVFGVSTSGIVVA